MNKPMVKREFTLTLILEPGQELPARMATNRSTTYLLYPMLRKMLELGDIVDQDEVTWPLEAKS